MDIDHAITIDASRDEVFDALTDAPRLERWMATSAESEPRTGGAFRYSFEFDDPAQNNEQSGKYVEVVRGQRVVLPWTFPFSPTETHVEYDLEERDGETVVRFRHSGFESGEPWDTARERFVGGWRAFLEALKSHVEDGADARPLGMR